MRKAILVLVMIATGTVCAAAQQGGRQNPVSPPPAQPSPDPAASAPSSNRQPGLMRIAGKLMANGPLPQPLAVRLEGQSGEQVAYAYVGEDGDFELPMLALDPFQIYYIIAKVDGFKLVRQTLNIGRETVFAPRIMVFLERDVADSADETKGRSVISTKQLAAKIPDKAVAEYKKARKDLAEGNYSKVVEHLERALELAPDYYEAQNDLGTQYLRTQRFRDAEKAFERAQSLNPGADEPLINLGSLYYQEGQTQSSSDAEEAAATFRKAVASLQQAIRKNPLSATAHQYLGAALYKTGSYDQAEPALRRALELDNGLAEAEFALVNVYTRQNRYAEALQQIDSFLKRNPKSTQRAVLENLRQQIEKAVQPPR
jgi:Flp pilus assembly protein TadD